MVPPEFFVHNADKPRQFCALILAKPAFLIRIGLITDKALIYYVMCNTETLTHTAGHKLYMEKTIIYHICVSTAILQRFSSRATFRHSDQTISTSLVLSSGLSALRLPFTAFALKLYFTSVPTAGTTVKSYLLCAGKFYTIRIVF